MDAPNPILILHDTLALLVYVLLEHESETLLRRGPNHWGVLRACDYMLRC